MPPLGSGTCGNTGYQSTLESTYTNLGQLWQGPKNGGNTQEQYLYCDSAHPHQLSTLSQSSSTPTCSSKGTVDYAGSYDDWGNVTTQVRDGITRTLAYDGLDHLVRWNSSVNGQEEWNLYDASGERVLSRTYDGSKTAITVYAFGTEEHEYSYSGSGSSATNTSNTYYYTLGGQELALWDGTSPTTNFLLTDTLGSVVSTFNNLPSGGATVLGDQAYGPYGNKRVQQGTINTSKGFTGQYTDYLTGLDYYGARYYDPVVGAFVSVDVVQGNGSGMDPYSYVGGNPETRTDPTGNRACDICQGDPVSAPTPPSTSTTFANTAAQTSFSKAAAPSFHSDICSQIGCNMGVQVGVDTVHAVVTQSHVDGLVPACLGFFCMLARTSTTISTVSYYRSQSVAYGVICTLGFDCYGRGGSGESGGSGGTDVAPSSDGGSPPASTSTEGGTSSEAPTMNPGNIGFTQNQISDQGNGYTVTDNIDRLRSGTLDPNQMGDPIRVFQKTPEMNSWGAKTKYGYTGDPQNLIDGGWYSLDNRRLFAFQQAGVENISVQVLDDLAVIKNQRWKFDTASWGIDITLRK